MEIKEDTTMKKNYFLRAIAVLSLAILLTLSGCSESKGMKKYTAYAIDAGEIDGGSSGTISGIRLFEIKNEALPEPQKTITLTILGKEYTADYVQSTRGRLGGASFLYRTPEKDEIIISSSGDLLEFRSSLRHSHWTTEYNCSDEEAEKINAKAIEVASGWLREMYGDNLDFEYTPKVSDTIITNSIWVRFRPNVQSDPNLPYKYALDQITFQMTTDYELLAFYPSATFGKYKGKVVPDDFTLDTVREIVGKMATDSNTKIELQCDVENWEVKQFDVFPLLDGRMVCRTFVYVNGNTEDRVEVIIPLE